MHVPVRRRTAAREMQELQVRTCVRNAEGYVGEERRLGKCRTPGADLRPQCRGDTSAKKGGSGNAELQVRTCVRNAEGIRRRRMAAREMLTQFVEIGMFTELLVAVPKPIDRGTLAPVGTFAGIVTFT